MQPETVAVVENGTQVMGGAPIPSQNQPPPPGLATNAAGAAGALAGWAFASVSRKVWDSKTLQFCGVITDSQRISVDLIGRTLRADRKTAFITGRDACSPS